MRTMVVVLGALCLVVAGCGGGASRSRGTDERTSHAAPRTRSLREILGPLGAHQTPGQLAEIAAFIRRWERDPMAPVPENDTERSTQFLVMAWLVESPDVSVIAVTGVQMLAEGRGADVGGMVTMGSMFGMAAYLIEHPGLAPTSDEVQAAGVASALLWYEASLRRGEGHNEMLDELLVVRDRGELVQWWAAHVEVGEGGG
jgi:hypothetical protein